jgi:hypothetical protein
MCLAEIFSKVKMAHYSIQTRSEGDMVLENEEDMTLEYNLTGAFTMALQKFLCISYTKIQQ